MRGPALLESLLDALAVRVPGARVRLDVVGLLGDDAGRERVARGDVGELGALVPDLGDDVEHGAVDLPRHGAENVEPFEDLVEVAVKRGLLEVLDLLAVVLGAHHRGRAGEVAAVVVGGPGLGLDDHWEEARVKRHPERVRLHALGDFGVDADDAELLPAHILVRVRERGLGLGALVLWVSSRRLQTRKKDALPLAAR